MDSNEKKTVPEQILDELFNSLSEMPEFNEELLSRLSELAKFEKLSHQKHVEDLLISQTLPNEDIRA